MTPPVTRSRKLPAAVTAAALALLLLSVVGSLPARASCASPEPIEQAVRGGDVVFVGTVTGLENGGRWVTVRVEERWRSSVTLQDAVAIRGGPAAGSATSIDRVYVAARYLFVVTPGPEYFVDNACTPTRLWSRDLALLRPDGVPPAPEVATNAPAGALDELDLVPVAGLIGALLVAVVSYILILRSRRKPADWIR